MTTARAVWQGIMVKITWVANLQSCTGSAEIFLPRLDGALLIELGVEVSKQEHGDVDCALQ